MKFTVRECKENDIEIIADYFITASTDYLEGMGVDKNKFPKRDEYIVKLQHELTKPYSEKELYYIVWEQNGKAVGHSNVNNIIFGEVATMHLHVWNPQLRQNGLGTQFLKKTIPLYFKNLELKKLICQPYAKNISPNKTLQKVGFNFVKNYKTVPGPINFYQEVNLYEIHKNALV